MLGPVVACDIETDGISPLVCNIVCLCVSDGDRTLVIDPWLPQEHAPLLTEAFRSRRVVFHNGYNFDHLPLERDGVEFGVPPDDTLIAHHAYASHFPQKLDQLASEFCDASPWKMAHGMRGGGEEKGNMPHQMAPEERDLYNAIDGVMTFRCWERMQNDLAAERVVYEHDLRLADMCKRMQVDGIAMDMAFKADLSSGLAERADELRAELRALLNWPDYEPSKTQSHVRRALYDVLKAPTLAATEKGQPATSEAVLEQLAVTKDEAGRTVESDTPIGRFARGQMTWRLVKKVKSTYVDIERAKRPIYIDGAGRAHYNWKSFGTVSGRLAGRLQSCPRYGSLPEQRPREMYIANGLASGARLVAQIHDAAIFEVGDTLVYFDLAQAEARLAAYLSGDDALIAAVQTDIHTANALLMFADIPEAVRRLRMANDKGPGGIKWKNIEKAAGGCKEMRDVTKNFGFCVWYVGSADKVYATAIAKGFPVTMRVCNAFYNRCHDTYWRYYKYVDRNLALVQQRGYIRTAGLGRLRWLGYYPPITDVANYPIQGGIADIMNDRLMGLEAAVRGMTRAEDVKAAIVSCWARPVQLRKGDFCARDVEFVLPADIKIGHAWSEL